MKHSPDDKGLVRAVQTKPVKSMTWFFHQYIIIIVTIIY